MVILNRDVSRRPYPSARLLGLTWLGWLNLVLLQWMCLALEAVVDGPPDDASHDTISGWRVVTTLPLVRWRTRYKALGVAWLVVVVLIVWGGM